MPWDQKNVYDSIYINTKFKYSHDYSVQSQNSASLWVDGRYW